VKTSLSSIRVTRPRVAGWLAAAAALLVLAPTVASADVGFIDASITGASAPSGMKPQSKLWVADGIWWGAMFNAFTQRYEIYRRTAGSETWASTGTVIDGRKIVWTDAKWDGSHLSIVSHGASGAATLDGIRVSRYSYDSTAKTWSLNSGFPVTNVGTTPGHDASTGTEGAVLDTDSSGRIWITWTRDQKVWVTHSTTDTQTFTTPIVVPLPNADNLTADDMSTLIAFDGRIGVLWSNQTVMCMCFAVHADGDPDSTWTSKPLAAPAANPADRSQQLADDHMNLKAPNDGSGRVYAITKTSTNALNDPLELFSSFDGSNWSTVTAAKVADDVTRAQIALDMQHNIAHVFLSGPCCNGGVVFHKQTSLTPGRIGFQAGRGEPFIQSAANVNINNPSTTKQPVSNATGIVVIASDDHSKRYAHNTLDLSLADTTPPDTSIASGPTGTVNNAEATFAFSTTEPGSTFECRLDEGAYATCSSPRSYLGLANGSHTLEVRAVDPASNVDATPASRTWTVEDTTTTLDVPAEADTYATSASPSLNYGTKTALNIDMSSTADPSDKQAFFRFAVSGTRKIVSAKLRLWVTDGSVVGPSILSTSADWGEGTLTWANRPTATGAALASNPAAVAKNVWLEYDVTAAVTANGTYGFTATTASGDGLAVASRESATAGTRPMLRLRVNPAPDSEIKSAPTAVAKSSTAGFAFASNQADSTFECRIDNGAYAGCTTPASFSGLADGSHTFSVRAKDGGGNADPSPATHTWSIDTVGQAPPTLALATASDTGASTADGITADTTPTFEGRAEPGSLVGIVANGVDLGNAPADAAGDWIFNSDDLPSGTYTVTATATDGAGNQSAPSSLTVVIDTTPPNPPTITDPAGDVVNSPSLTVGGVATAGVRVELLDGATTVGATTADATDRWSIGLTGLSDGSHALTAVTRDAAGNASGAVKRNVTVDTVAPDTTITTSPADPTSSSAATFAFSSSQTGSTFECRLDGGAYSACTSPKSYTVAGGPHTVEVRATDEAANTDATPASRTWTVEGGVPAALSDGFESGTLSSWVVGKGGDGTAVVETDAVKSGVYAARLTASVNTDSFARLRFALPAPRNDVSVDEDIRIEAQGASGANVPLLRLFDSAGNRLLSLYRQNVATGTLHVSYGSPATTVALGKTLSLGTWAGFSVRTVTGPANGGSVTISMNGVPIYAKAQATLGTAGIATIQIGNDTKKQAFSLAVDNAIITQR
jgi:hypothetical protein